VAARGATAYVTLEPCSHEGRTPPCSAALASAGVARVVVALRDPNPVAQGGAAALASRGVEVCLGTCANEAEGFIEPWLTAMRLGRPFVAVKAAISLDGRVALPSGESKWITSEASRRQGRRLRAELGAVAVGAGTVIADDPELSARLRGVKNPPLRIALDPRARLTGRERVFRGTAPALWVVAEGNARSAAQTEVRAHEGRFELDSLLALLWRRGLTGLLVEGGPTTISRFLEAGLVDRVDLFVAPRLLGSGPAWIEGLRFDSLEGTLALERPRVRRIGIDLWIQAAVKRP
jgi:diaminohydroxyphosphoribosylaminopyrimidine deaminase/5-amino-6-(5-phosphoribosylamino)uracil reductase